MQPTKRAQASQRTAVTRTAPSLATPVAVEPAALVEDALDAARRRSDEDRVATRARVARREAAQTLVAQEYEAIEFASSVAPPPRFKHTPKPDGSPGTVAPDMKQSALQFAAAMHAVGGGIHADGNHQIVSDLSMYALLAHESAADGCVLYNALLAQVTDLAPNGTLEAMLCAQIAVTHSAAIRALARAVGTRQMDQGTYHHTQATRLMRLFTLQMDALNKHRGKGPSEQKVTVEHVHVYAGGQAVVGNVAPGGAGSGGTNGAA